MGWMQHRSIERLSQTAEGLMILMMEGPMKWAANLGGGGVGVNVLGGEPDLLP